MSRPYSIADIWFAGLIPFGVLKAPLAWDAACSIRGAKDAPKYKEYILPLIFAKRLCDVFDDEYVSAIHNAMEAPTWGKFKDIIPPKEYESLLKKVQDGETEQDKVSSDDESPFDPGVWFPEWYDGDYPDWIQQEQGKWLPKSVIKRFAEQVNSVHNGLFWSIKARSEKSIVRELRRIGFKVTRRDDLIFF